MIPTVGNIARFQNNITHHLTGGIPVTPKEWREIQKALNIGEAHPLLTHAYQTGKVPIAPSQWDKLRRKIDVSKHPLLQPLRELGLPARAPMSGGAMLTGTDVLASSIASAAAITGTTTETIWFPNYTLAAGASVGSPAGAYYQGKMIWLKAYGVYTSAASAQGTLAAKIHMGAAGTNADLLVVSSQAITVPASGSNNGAVFDALLTMNAIGSSGNTVIGSGSLTLATVTTGVPVLYSLNGGNGSAAPAAVAVNTTVSNLIGFYLTFSSATTNASTCAQWLVAELN